MSNKKSQFIIGIIVLITMLSLFYIAEYLLFSAGTFTESERFGRISIHHEWLK